MRIAEIAIVAILGLFSIYLMWKSGEAAGWNPNAQRFRQYRVCRRGGAGQRILAFLARRDHAHLLRPHRVELVPKANPRVAF